MTKLVFIGAEGAPEVPIPPSGVTFGRAPDCDLPIQEGSVSGHHGSLRFEGGRWWLHDNNSSNGSFVNGQRIADSPLNNGDTLQFGDAGKTVTTSFSAAPRHSAAVAPPRFSASASAPVFTPQRRHVLRATNPRTLSQKPFFPLI